MMENHDDEEEETTQCCYSDNIEFILALGVVAYTVVRQEIEEEEEEAEENKKRKRWARPQPRGPRQLLQHQRAYDCIHTDWLGPAPSFGKTFKAQFRLSRARVQKIMEAFGNSGDPYYCSDWKQPRQPCPGRNGPVSLEARVLLPLKTLAFGVTAIAFGDYFQMSDTTARVSCDKFHKTINKCFGGEYLRLPTPSDLRSVTALHKRVHGVDGMLGSLDCMHTYWKNCPVGWQGSFQGKDKGQSTVILEAVADHYLWFWHASYGYSGALNDINVLQLSPLMQRLCDGTFVSTEVNSGVVPFDIGTFGLQFNHTFMLVDGIYPKWSRFVRGYKEPVTDDERAFTSWQEGARKDVERAFGVFQCKFKAVANPIHIIDPKKIGVMVRACLILHNMDVSDRVMGDVNRRYEPGSVEQDQEEIPIAEDVDGVDGGAGENHLPPPAPPIEPRLPGGGEIAPVAVAPPAVERDFARELAMGITIRNETRALSNEVESYRLQRALIDYVYSWKTANHDDAVEG
jgi:hypothetical protein